MSERHAEFSIEAYMTDATIAARAISQRIDNHGSPRDYLEGKRELITQTDLYKNFRARLNEIGGRAIIMSGIENRRNLMENITILSDPSFDDGFVFGMQVNGTLLTTKHEKDMADINVLNPSVNKILDGFEEMVDNGADLDWEIGKYGLLLYNGSIAHPDDKNFRHIKQQRDPLHALVTHITQRMYIEPVLGGPSLAMSNGHAAVNNFKRGFGYARSAYTDYTMVLNQRLQEQLDTTPSTDDTPSK